MYESTLVNRAAMYLLMYNGKRATPKQIAQLVQQLGMNVIRMARDRGFAE